MSRLRASPPARSLSLWVEKAVQLTACLQPVMAAQESAALGDIAAISTEVDCEVR